MILLMGTFFSLFFFFFNDTATTEIYTLSLHDALPISRDYLAQCLCRLFERTDRRDRHAKGAAGQQLREGRKLPTVGPDVDVGYGDAPFLPRRVARDRGEAAAVSNRLQRGVRLPAGSVDRLGRAAAGDLANERRPVAVVVEHLRRAVVADALGL